MGADWVVLPAIELKGQYLNNINNSPKNVQSDYILSAQPSVSLSYNTEITQFEGKLALSGLHYLQNSGLDRINQYYWLKGSQKVAPRLALNLGGSFISDSTATEELLASGTVINRQLRTSFSITPGFTYNITELLSTSFAYGYYVIDYQDRFYNNYDSHFITNNFNYLLNERTSLISKLTASFTSYKNDSSIASLGPQIGFSHKYEEKWDFLFLGGLSISNQRSKTRVFSAPNQLGFVGIPQKEQTSTSIAPFFSVTGNYKWETGSVGLSYSRSQSANAFGNQSQYNAFYINTNQSITSRLVFSFNPYFYTSTIDNPGSDYNSYYYGIRPGLSYKLTEKLVVGANYGFAYRTTTGSSSYSYPINDVWITVNYSYPIHHQY